MTSSGKNIFLLNESLNSLRSSPADVNVSNLFFDEISNDVTFDVFSDSNLFKVSTIVGK